MVAAKMSNPCPVIAQAVLDDILENRMPNLIARVDAVCTYPFDRVEWWWECQTLFYTSTLQWLHG